MGPNILHEIGAVDLSLSQRWQKEEGQENNINLELHDFTV
jgi:hypothetical protein